MSLLQSDVPMSHSRGLSLQTVMLHEAELQRYYYQTLEGLHTRLWELQGSSDQSVPLSSASQPQGAEASSERNSRQAIQADSLLAKGLLPQKASSALHAASSTKIGSGGLEEITLPDLDPDLEPGEMAVDMDIDSALERSWNIGEMPPLPPDSPR